ncbi:MAG: hypothetical protein HY017_15805 [Betaproteobacteria bacterium]|nr:hypothetical protein [Betaproteobacteria bacterium]
MGSVRELKSLTAADRAAAFRLAVRTDPHEGVCNDFNAAAHFGTLKPALARKPPDFSH